MWMLSITNEASPPVMRPTHSVFSEPENKGTSETFSCLPTLSVEYPCVDPDYSSITYFNSQRHGWSMLKCCLICYEFNVGFLDHFLASQVSGLLSKVLLTSAAAVHILILRQSFTMLFRPVQNSLYGPCKPQIHGNSPTSTS